MRNINFLKPIVLVKSLDDMKEEHRAQALSFLDGKEVLLFEKDGMNIIPFRTLKAGQIYFDGSEAVCMYRSLLGYPNVGIRSIDVNKILESVKCYECLYDIIYMLRRVDNYANRFSRLAELNAPAVIMLNEYRVLRERVEYLQDNNWCEDPILDSYDTRDDDGNVEHHDDIRMSLVNIGYDLLTGACEE